MNKRLAVVSAVAVLGLGTTAFAVAPALADTSTPPAVPVINTALQASILKALAGLVSDGTITQAQAQKVAATLAAIHLPEPPKPSAPPRPSFPPLPTSLPLPTTSPRPEPPKPSLPPLPTGVELNLIGSAASILGISPSDLLAQLKAGGTTITQIAAGKGISRDALLSGLSTAAQSVISGALAAGKITPSQAAAMTAGLAAQLTSFIGFSFLPVPLPTSLPSIPGLPSLPPFPK